MYVISSISLIFLLYNARPTTKPNLNFPLSLGLCFVLTHNIFFTLAARCLNHLPVELQYSLAVCGIYSITIIFGFFRGAKYQPNKSFCLTFRDFSVVIILCYFNCGRISLKLHSKYAGFCFIIRVN